MVTLSGNAGDHRNITVLKIETGLDSKRTGTNEFKFTLCHYW